MRLSLVIPCKSKADPKLAELLASIERQDFPKEDLEVLVITEGTSESAKAIGIRQAKGEVIGILASDNVLMHSYTLRYYTSRAKDWGAAYPAYYFCRRQDDILTRYFALIGGNDPLSFYLQKNDRLPQYLHPSMSSSIGKSTGDNGFFVKKELIENTDLSNYYHIDNSQEIGIEAINDNGCAIVHNTGGNLLSFFRKRYRYGLEHAFNPNRRWHLVERTPRDICRLLLFIFLSLTLVEPLYLSIRGYSKVKDVAWFMHPPVCLLTVFTYGLLMLHLLARRLYQWSSAPWTVRQA